MPYWPKLFLFYRLAHFAEAINRRWTAIRAGLSRLAGGHSLHSDPESGSLFRCAFAEPLYFDRLFRHLSAVPFKRAALETEAELYEVAVRALTRRAHSVSEMKKLLARRTESELLVQVVMARLKESGQLDDSRYAQQFVRQRKEIRRQGTYRIARELRARGVPDRHIDVALESMADPEAERAAIRHRIERKLKSWRGEIDERKTASLYRSLLRAGFATDAIRRELKKLESEELVDDDVSAEEA